MKLEMIDIIPSKTCYGKLHCILEKNENEN